MGTLITKELGATTGVWCVYRSFNSAIIGKYKNTSVSLKRKNESRGRRLPQFPFS